MTIDNGKKIVSLRLTGFIATVIYVLYIFIAYFPKVFKHVMTERSLTTMTIVVTVAYLFLLLLPAIMKYRYIFFSADERTITLRWYKTGLIPGESMSIEIPVNRYAGYEITRQAMGLVHYLTLFQQVQGRKASYPPVSITALSGAQRREIEKTLKGYRSVG
ncbi:MAG TPA: hypothetical protein PLB07_11400 [Bacteroidales bacterium]|jgi:hypothetical protein|nr:hypothetical protein [Bacteroidales bacterium]OPZ54710.1 MAG: hypothetical protein BWY89_01543 [Bacteroidetes bacterium ADurb.BinA012]HHU99413.1 hypothetical protein [Bacteroidales bacterium]HMT67477.1 hypothetical protein [Bacteroidales bacterium]HNV67873.1 hypothetical protein [Bacteroidales bacterium]